MKLSGLQGVNYKILSNFSINFTVNDKILDLIVLAGVNGSGKSTLLEYIYSHSSGPGSKYLDFQDANSGKVEYIRAKDDKSIDLKKSITRYIKELIFEHNLTPQDSYKKFNSFLQSTFKGLDLSITFDKLDKDEKLYFKNSFNQIVLIDELSTGEKEILNKAFYFYVNKIKNSLILIDEPEISLHPTWQSAIFNVYKNLAEEFNNQIIIATHSPQIIASTPGDNLIILYKENNIVTAKKLEAYGKDINSVLIDIMGSNYLRDAEVEKQIELIKSYIYKEDFNSSNFKEEFKKLENMLENDNIELSLIKLEIKRRKNAKSN